jgi:hypothetical protein
MTGDVALLMWLVLADKKFVLVFDSVRGRLHECSAAFKSCESLHAAVSPLAAESQSLHVLELLQKLRA